ncbi:MAG: radical SAM protein [Deltaproteobacteria bacterium]|nr:MAG: radical SAM protein [Deltaproteobacteria bacterium]
MTTMEPSYIDLYKKGDLAERVEVALSRLAECKLCPRQCGVNRLEGEKGFCKTGRKAIVASYNAHFGEESPLVGQYGSGTIFMSSCNLLCSFCQNFEISHFREGREVEPEQMAAMMLALAQRGCHNINFVTPTHVIPQILEALLVAVREGLRVPLVYNTSGYDEVGSIELLEGIFDIYMPDFKFWDPKWAERYCHAPDYPEKARTAIKEMHRQVGDLVIDDRGIAQRGLLIRHLVMPNNIAGTKEIMQFIATELSPNTYVNVMDQYRPCGKAYEDEFINRRLTGQEFRSATQAAKKAGLTRLDPRDRIRIVFGI